MDHRPNAALLAALLLAAAPLAGARAAPGAGPQPGFEEPGEHSTIAASPNELRISFKEALDPAGSGMTVTNAAGKSVGMDGSHVSPSDPSLLTVGVNELPSGTYTVTWHSTSKKSHAKSHGSYTFTIAK